MDSVHWYKYLHGEIRQGPGWWYYYLYCVLVKTHVGALLLLVTGGIWACISRHCRVDAVTETALFIPAIALFALVSCQTGYNSHLRYALPVFPFVFVFSGRLGRLLERGSGFWLVWVGGGLVATAASTLSVHPYYLSYFNEAVGGADRGFEHLADSNVDWGHGLLALRDWLKVHGQERPLFLAYFGRMAPEILGINYRVPPFGPKGTSGVGEAQGVEPGVGPTSRGRCLAN